MRTEPLASRYKYRRRSARHFEALLLVILILVFIGTATEKIGELRIAVERTGVAHMVGTLRSALGIAVAEKIVRGGLSGVAAMDRINPMGLLELLPANYLGELDAPDPATVEGYRWYFDTADHTLVYRVGNSDVFETSLPGPARIRFQVRLSYADRNQDGRFDPATDEIGRLELVELEPYRWKQE